MLFRFPARCPFPKLVPDPLFSAKQQFRNFIRISCGHPWSGRIERAIGILGYLVKKSAQRL